MMKRRALLVAAAVAVVGCAAPPKKQAFNREAAGGLKVVAVAQQPNQDSYEAAVIGHPGASFGLIGGLIAAADIAGKSSKLTAAISPSETKLQERFAQITGEKLKLAGYDVRTVPVAKDATDTHLLDAARQVPEVHAVLSTQLIGAYWAAGPATPYVPRLVAKVRLLDAKSGSVLFEDLFTYGYTAPQIQSIHAAADARYSFKDIDSLIADPGVTRQGLLDGVEAMATQIAADLKRQ